MRLNDALIGAVLVPLALVIWLYARTLPAIPGQEYGAAVFPMLVACGLGACGLILLATGVRGWQGAVTWGDWARSRRGWLNLVVTVGLVIFYIAASPFFGFVPVAFVLLFALLTMLGTRPWVGALVAVAVTLLVQQSFARLLLVPLPRGTLWP